MEFSKRNVKIVKHNRKWSEVELQKDNDHKDAFKTRVLKCDVEQYTEGDIVEIECFLKMDYNLYGSTSELIVKNGMSEKTKKEAQRNKNIEKWISYFRDSAKEDRYYSRAVEELHNLRCYDYDSEIDETKKRVDAIKKKEDIQKWISYFRENARKEKPYYYYRAVEELHKLGCNDYDQEINNTKIRIERELEEKRKEEESKYCKLFLEAFDGFNGRPEIGQIIIDHDRVYEVVSSYYNKYDGLTFGVMTEEYYSVKAIDITDTDKGKTRILIQNMEKNVVSKGREVNRVINDIRTAINNMGNRIEDGHNLSEYLEKNIVDDTLDIYGGGHIISHDDSFAYYIINNGADGDNWGMNNIGTGGAGAYGYYAKLINISAMLDELSKAKEELDKAKKELDNFKKEKNRK